uniref:TMV resistance protein N-like n=1 Tax=Erigeron canadensis TaxID=72917 RepID=UPI001CB937A5|nr:TMV resistance protein N-like [Erigeron canadensis]
MKKLRFLEVNYSSSYYEGSYDEGLAFLSNELRYIELPWYSASPFLESFKATKLVVLKLYGSLQKELWKGCKHLPCLKELQLSNADYLERTPDFGGLPCLQKLTLYGCDSLKEIDPSLGNHSRLAYISIGNCDKLTRFPTIVWMEKLERLKISYCDSLCEFPEIEAKMDSLVELCLTDVGIEVLPSSVGRCCTNLISLQLINCSNLKCIEGNFRALKHLQKFELASSTKFVWVPKDLFYENCCLENLFWYVTLCVFDGVQSSLPHLPRLLKKLNLNGHRLKDGEIPCEIGELSNLQELHLCQNDFSRLDFSLFQLTKLKLLDLSGCHKLLELPELPTNLSILQAINCDSLEAIRDDVHRNCEWLCQVSITIQSEDGLCNILGSERLLKTMLQGKAQALIMELNGLEVPQRFKPCLAKGRRCRLRLPENWFNEFSGFLFCYVSKEHFWYDSVTITMGQEEEKQQMQMETGCHQDEQVFWMNESADSHTWMGYVSFESFRGTTWWEKTVKTSTAIDVSIDAPFSWDNSLISGFGARLVFKKNQMEKTITRSNHSYEDDDYRCKFNILRDSRSLFECSFIQNSSI